MTIDKLYLAMALVSLPVGAFNYWHDINLAIAYGGLVFGIGASWSVWRSFT